MQEQKAMSICSLLTSWTLQWKALGPHGSRLGHCLERIGQDAIALTRSLHLKGGPASLVMHHPTQALSAHSSQSVMSTDRSVANTHIFAKAYTFWGVWMPSEEGHRKQ